MMHAPRQEGVEEQKEMEQEISPRMLSQSQENDEEERQHGFQAQMQNIVRIIFGSCGTAMEAASIFVQGQGCTVPQWSPPSQQRHPAAAAAAAAPPQQMHPQQQPPLQSQENIPARPLSIADELRLLAAKEGRPFPEPAPRSADIPRFLGEEAVNSFEDDNISAISQQTLEELMELNGVVHPHRIRQQQLLQKKLKDDDNNNNVADDDDEGENEPKNPPSPTETTSLSSSSSKKKRLKKL